MNKNNPFSDISNWERVDEEVCDSNVTNKWVNAKTGYVMRTITNTRPFDTHLPDITFQVREVNTEDSGQPEDNELWSDETIIEAQTHLRKSEAVVSAFRFASAHNDPEE